MRITLSNERKTWIAIWSSFFFIVVKSLMHFYIFFLNRRENKFIHINLSIFIKLIKPNKNSKTVKSDYAFISLTDSLIYNKKGHRINYLMIFQTRILKIDSMWFHILSKNYEARTKLFTRLKACHPGIFTMTTILYIPPRIATIP